MTLDPKRAWQVSVDDGGPLPLDDIRKLADRFYRAFRRRNLIEYVACAIALPVFVYWGFTMPHVLHKIGAALLVAAAVFCPWQLHRRASVSPPDAGGTLPTYAYLRGQFVRQRDAFRSLFWWYAMPFIPGMALIFAGNGLDPQIEAAGPPIWQRWLVLGVIGAVLALVYWLNRRAARRMQARIDEIDALTRDLGAD